MVRLAGNLPKLLKLYFSWAPWRPCRSHSRRRKLPVIGAVIEAHLILQLILQYTTACSLLLLRMIWRENFDWFIFSGVRDSWVLLSHLG